MVFSLALKGFKEKLCSHNSDLDVIPDIYSFIVHLFYRRCPEDIGHHNVKMSFYMSVFLSCHIFKAPDWSKEGMLHR